MCVFWTVLSCFNLEIQLPPSVSNYSFVNFLKPLGVFWGFFTRAELRHFPCCVMVHAIGSGEIWRDKVEIDGKKGEKVERKKKEKWGKEWVVKEREAKMGSLAVSCYILAKSRPVQDVNKLICQCEVFTHLGFFWALWLMQPDCPAFYSPGVFSLPCSRGHQDYAGLLCSLNMHTNSLQWSGQKKSYGFPKLKLLVSMQRQASF